MSITIFPEASTSTLNAEYYVIANYGTQYKLNRPFTPGLYTISTSPTTSNATVSFFLDSTITTVTTVSGTIAASLANTMDYAIVTTDGGSNVNLTIEKVASALSTSTVTGTLDTITSTQTYNQTGRMMVLAVGGGGAGGAGGPFNQSNANTLGGGGGAGENKYGVFYNNNAISVTIGSSGNATSTHGNAGGSTTFGNLLTATGGNGGNGAPNGVNGEGGTTGNVITGGNGNNSGIISPFVAKGVKDGTNGGGGGGNGSGAGSGIGTGGNGGNPGNNGTGYGAGGGGGTRTASAGNGSAGVIYVLRGF